MPSTSLKSPRNGVNRPSKSRKSKSNKSRSINLMQQSSNSKFPYHERRYLDPLEQAIPFFYTTHSLFALAAILVPLIYIAIINPPTYVKVQYTLNTPEQIENID